MLLRPYNLGMTIPSLTYFYLQNCRMFSVSCCKWLHTGTEEKGEITGGIFAVTEEMTIE